MATISTFAAFSSRGFNSAGGKVMPTGGNYVIDNNGAGKRVHVFTSPGTFVIPAGAVISTKFLTTEILLVGGGGNAGAGNSETGGGGGGGGSVVYDSGFRIPKGYSISVTVGSQGGTSRIEGLPAAGGGGPGGNNNDYSKGNPGGSGGGGSWQNGAPNGPAYSVANPGATWGTSGPSAPANVTTAFPTPALGPAAPAPAPAITRTWNSGYHDNRGNGQYGCTTNAPDSTKGVAGTISTPAPGTSYSAKAFRMRGGGGAAYVGGLGGQGVLTDYLNKENGIYEWIGAGGNGDIPGSYRDSWNSRRAQSGNYGLRDSGVVNGVFYGASQVWTGGTQDWSTDLDNVDGDTWGYNPAGRDGYGSGGSHDPESDGSKGIILLRYLASAVTNYSANIFGGAISSSANGQYVYHMWNGDSAALKGTSANSQTFTAFNDENYYRARTFNGDADFDYTWYAKKDGNDGRPPGANTEPFYYYADVPSFTVDYLVLGGGGSMGTKGTSVEGYPNAFLPGGGGSGGIQMGQFTTTYRAPASWNMPSLPTSLANSASFVDQISGTFSHRVGYIEVRANSLLNDKLTTNMYLSSLSDSWQANSKERSGTIRIRGSDITKARLLQRIYREVRNDTYFGTVTGDNQDRYYVYFGATGVGNPESEGWGSSIYLSGYDDYFYANYTRVRAGRKYALMTTDDSGPNAVVSDGTPAWSTDIAFTFGTWSGSHSNFQAGVATGTHPQTGEAYYNAIRLDRGMPKYSSGSDDLATNRYNQFHTKISSFNSSSPGWTTGMVAGLQNVDPNFDRSFTFNVGSVFGASRNLFGTYILQAGNDTATRYPVHIDGPYASDDLTVFVPAGWKIVDVNSTTVNRMTYTTNSGDDVKTHIEVWKRSLRKIYVKFLFAHDVDVGAGGKGNKQPLARRRSGGTTAIHAQTRDTPEISVGGGGGGGWNGYDNEGEAPEGGGNRVSRSDRSPGTYGGAGVGSSVMNWGTLSPAGSGGGAAWWMGDTAVEQAYPTPGGSAATNGSSSDTLTAYAGGGGGGGAVSLRDFSVGGVNNLQMGGATRGTFSTGRNSKRNAGYADSGHGGRGYFGSTSNWAGTVGSYIVSGTTYYYYVDVNQFPHNAQFSAGGGGGAGGNGNDGAISNGGTGGDGVSYSLTGYSTVYGHGGGGFGRKTNGSPGSGMPADPSTAGVPAGAPDGPAFKPYGGGGGWSAGKQEGLGAGATGYYPGNQPWPLAYDVALGNEHMDAMRYYNSPVPAPQKGNVGSPYNGKQGVVIIAYDRTQFFS